MGAKLDVDYGVVDYGCGTRMMVGLDKIPLTIIGDLFADMSQDDFNALLHGIADGVEETASVLA